jgi:hypothetical protein
LVPGAAKLSRLLCEGQTVNGAMVKVSTDYGKG